MRRFILAAAVSVLTVAAGVPAAASPVPGQGTKPGIAAQHRRQAVRQRAARILRERWPRMDVDRSGTLTRNEWRGRPQAFDRIDRNRDGVITRAEFVRAVRRAARRR